MLKEPQFLDMRKVESFADVVNGVSFMMPNGTATTRAEGTITTSDAKYVTLLNGVMRRLWIYIQSTTGISGAFLIDNLGNVRNIQSQLVAGQWVEISQGYNYGTLFNNNPTAPQKEVQLFTGGTFAATQNFAIVAEFWPILNAANTFRIKQTV
jgi:hypothetical protein